MDERMWLMAYDAGLLFDALHRWGEAQEPTGQRRFRLIAVAFCRAIEGHYHEDKDAVERVNLAERAADDTTLIATFPVPEVEMRRERNDDPEDFISALRATWAVVESDASGAASTCCRQVGLVSPTIAGLTYRWRANLVRDIFGNPFRPVAFDPAWRSSTAVALARGIYDDRAFDRMPILADALQDAGCDNDDILNHCRHDTVHARGCWVVDLVLGLL